MRVNKGLLADIGTGVFYGALLVGIVFAAIKSIEWLYQRLIVHQPIQDFIMWATTESVTPVEAFFGSIGFLILLVLGSVILMYPMVGPRP